MDNIIKIFTFVNNLVAVSTTAITILELAIKMNYSGKKPDANMKKFLKNNDLYKFLKKKDPISPDELELIQFISKKLGIEFPEELENLNFKDLSTLKNYVQNLKKDKLKVKNIIMKGTQEYLGNLSKSEINL